MRSLPTTRHTRAGACQAMALVAVALLRGPVGVQTADAGAGNPRHLLD